MFVILSHLFFQEREQAWQVGKAASLAGMRVFDGRAPGWLSPAIHLPQAHQVRHVSSCLNRHQ